MKKLMSLFLLIISAFSSFGVTADSDTAQDQEKIKIPAVMYHHISQKTSLLNSYVITPDEFEADIAYLKSKGFESITPSELSAGKIPEKPVMITLDDGFLSTAKFALPILKRYGMRATVAVIGSVSDEYTLHPNTLSDCAYMDRAAVKELYDSGVFEIACHTYDMHSLSARKGCSRKKGESEEEYRRVLKEDLEKFSLFAVETGIEPTAIAFPYGEYSSLTVEIAREAGYSVIFTCDERVSEVVPGAAPYVIGRFNRPHNAEAAEFFAFLES